MSRSTFSAAGLTVLALGLGACGDDDVFRTDRPIVRITLDEYRIVPQNVVVKPGRLKFTVRNTGRHATHNLAVQIPEGPDGKPVDIARTETMQPGAAGEPIKVTLDPGEYRLVCTIANHDDLGQYGVLTVKEVSSDEDPARAFRDTIGRFPTGVAIVTTIGPDGPAGMTTNAVTSLSLEPLLLIVCFELRSRTLEVVRSSRRFAVNILRAGDEELATVFASKRVGPEKFEALTHHRWSEEHGVPVLDRALAWVACELRELLPGGDHEIGVGVVVGTGGRTAQEGEPLVFHRGAYTTLAHPRPT